jgi:hypothetical protein
LLPETEDFTVKLLGQGIPNRPGIYVELRSYFLHTHQQGPAGACEGAIGWVRSQLFYDLDDRLVHRLVSFESARLSRADIHVDWQGGYAPDAGAYLRGPAPVHPAGQDEVGLLRRGPAPDRLHLRQG